MVVLIDFWFLRANRTLNLQTTHWAADICRLVPKVQPQTRHVFSLLGKVVVFRLSGYQKVASKLSDFF